MSFLSAIFIAYLKLQLRWKVCNWINMSPFCYHTRHTGRVITSSNGNILRFIGPLCGEFAGHRWIPRTKACDAELWCFLWSAPWINGWANNHEADDLRRRRAHYDAIVMGETTCFRMPGPTVRTQIKYIVWQPNRICDTFKVICLVEFTKWYLMFLRCVQYFGK